MSKRVWVGLLAMCWAVTALNSSCFFPEQFRATLSIRNDGTYTATYEGVLTFVLARAAEIENGRLSPGDERDMEGLERELLKNPGFQSADYVGHGRFEVRYERRGRLDSSVVLIDKETKIVTIDRLEGGRVSVRGLRLTAEDLRQLSALKMTVDGRLDVKTDARVIEHNAASEPMFFGLLGAYRWNIRSPSDPAPSLILELEK